MIKHTKLFFACKLLTLLITITVSSCGGSSGNSPPPTYDKFGTPELITMINYNGDIMEPFFSRDEQYLFFNDNAAGGKNLHYSTYNSITDTFTYIGEVGPLINDNTSVQGVPTLDNSNTFFYIDTKFYNPLASPPVYVTMFTGTWTGASVTGVTPMAGLDFPSPGFLNFDLDISPDGNTLWFNDGFFSGNPFPEAADIKIANYNPGNGLFERDPNVDLIMANVNTATHLEYAPAISADGLELFFTRLDLDSMKANIYRTSRPDTSSAFGPALVVSSISSFAEGATFSQNEKTIYYHWHNTSSDKFELYRVTRP